MTIDDKTFELFIDQSMIEKRIRLMGIQIDVDYEDKVPIFIGVLNGSFMFMADLMKEVKIGCEITFVKLASYHGGTESSGKITEEVGLLVDIKGRDVIIVEDIVDTGKTLSEFLPQLNHQQPASLELAVLLHKPDATEYPTHIKYLGFSIPNKFVLGYGLDYDGLGRNIPEIYQLKEH